MPKDNIEKALPEELKGLDSFDNQARAFLIALHDILAVSERMMIDKDSYIGYKRNTDDVIKVRGARFKVISSA